MSPRSHGNISRFLEYHKAYFCSEKENNPLPYWLLFKRNSDPRRLFYDAEIRPLSYLGCPNPIYHLYGEKWISAKFLAAIVGACRPWHTDQETANETFREHEDEWRANIHQLDKERGWTDEKSKETRSFFISYLKAQHTMVHKVPMYKDLRRIMTHVRFFYGKGDAGILVVNDETQAKLDALYNFGEGDFKEITKYFLKNDYRKGTFFLNYKASLQVLNRYVKYNEPHASYVRIFRHQLGRYLKPARSRDKGRKIYMEVEYDPQVIYNTFGKVAPNVLRDFRSLEFMLLLRLKSELESECWVKDVRFESLLSQEDKIELGEISLPEDEDKHDFGELEMPSEPVLKEVT